MAEIEIKRIAADRASKIGLKGTSVTPKRVRGAEGEETLRWRIDANSPTLASDLTYVFGRSIADARRENKELFGSPDGVADRG